MSQLNPNAAEFVPVSPTRSIPSPACRLMHDPVIAQSPKRPSEVDINLPNLQDFEKEVKSRPSDVGSFSNGHDLEGDQKPVPQDLMENILNGKNIDEIPEFQPGSTPSKTTPAEEFHFGPNAAPFTPVKLMDQSETALSTKAVFGDESAVNLDSTLDTSRDNVDFTAKFKESDPMSMSFYQDRGDADFSDLNKVQILPENIDDFLNKSDDNIVQADTEQDLSDEVILNNDERIQTTDLDKVDDEKELASPVSNDDESSGVCELAKSPQPQIDNLIDQLECNLPTPTLPDVLCLRPESKSPQSAATDDLKIESPELEIVTPEPIEASPIPPAFSPVPQIETLIPQSPSPEPQPISPSPELRPEPELCVLSSKPEEPIPSLETQEPVLTPEVLETVVPQAEVEPASLVSFEPNEDVCQISKPPLLEAVSPEPVDVCSFTKTLEPEKVETPEPEKIITPEPEKVATPEPERLIELVTEERLVESPLEDITSSVKDVSSPISSPVADQDIQLNFAQEINNAVQSTVSITPSSPIQEENLVPELCAISTPRSVTDTESVATTDVNSFLERSQIVDLTSPLSPGDSTMTNHPLSKCVYPLPTEIETENITPEFAEPVVLSPTEPKEETPSVPSVEPTAKEPEVVEETPLVAAAAAGVAAAAVAAAATAVAASEKKPTKAKTPTATKKPAAKTAATPTKPTASPTKARAAPTTKAKPSTPAKTTPSTARTSMGATTKPPISKPAPKPKVPSTTAPKPIEKKPLANGDVKAPPRASLLARRSTDGAKPPLTKPASTTLNKASPTKPPTPRPITAPAKAAPKPATTTAAPKPRPTTLASRTVGSTVSRTVTSTTTTTKLNTARATTTTAAKTSTPPKPRPATAPAKPKVPATRTLSKPTADAEKQSKDSANKLTASRMGTSTRTTATAAGKTSTSTARKTELKTTGTTRTSLTKTTTTTTRPGLGGKKSIETIRNGTKITKTTKTETPVQNGVTTVATEETTIVNNALNNGETVLLKDNSPIDNKLLVETTNTAD